MGHPPHNSRRIEAIEAKPTTAIVAGTTAFVAGTTAIAAGTTAIVAGTTAIVAGTTAIVAGVTDDPVLSSLIRAIATWTPAVAVVKSTAMGAWGHESFANDSAMDWLGDLLEGDASGITSALGEVADADADTYLEVDESSAALAAAELVAAAQGKGDDRLNDDAREWLKEHRNEVADIDVGLAQRAVERVFASSELRELWDESAPDGDWHAEVKELLLRLAA